MNCPHCGHPINPAAILGAKGGKAKGESKRRSVDYAALQTKAAAKRRANRARRESEST